MPTPFIACYATSSAVPRSCYPSNLLLRVGFHSGNAASSSMRSALISDGESTSQPLAAGATCLRRRSVPEENNRRAVLVTRGDMVCFLQLHDWMNARDLLDSA